MKNFEERRKNTVEIDAKREREREKVNGVDY